MFRGLTVFRVSAQDFGEVLIDCRLSLSSSFGRPLNQGSYCCSAKLLGVR